MVVQPQILALSSRLLAVYENRLHNLDKVLEFLWKDDHTEPIKPYLTNLAVPHIKPSLAHIKPSQIPH